MGYVVLKLETFLLSLFDGICRAQLAGVDLQTQILSKLVANPDSIAAFQAPSFLALSECSITLHLKPFSPTFWERLYHEDWPKRGQIYILTNPGEATLVVSLDYRSLLEQKSFINMPHQSTGSAYVRIKKC